jgi:glycerol-3-phosphate cytidylyltransferase
MRVGFTASTFDLLHAGHVMMLREAKTVCDYLIVGLQTDPTIDRPEKNKPVQTLLERYIQLNAIEYVDEIVPYQTEQDLEDILENSQVVLLAQNVELSYTTTNVTIDFHLLI